MFLIFFLKPISLGHRTRQKKRLGRTRFNWRHAGLHKMTSLSLTRHGLAFYLQTPIHKNTACLVTRQFLANLASPGPALV